MATGSSDHPVSGARLQRTLAKAHNTEISTLAWSPDGRNIASASRDGTVRLSDYGTGRRRLTLKMPKGVEVRSIAWSPDGRLLATGSEDGYVRLWDTETGQRHKTLPRHTDLITTIAWSPSGDTLVSGSFGGDSKVWDAPTGKLRLAADLHTGNVWSVAWSPDGSTIASADLNQDISVWDPWNAEKYATLSVAPALQPIDIAWSPNGAILAAGCSDRSIRIFDISARRMIHVIEGHTGSVYTVSFSPDGALLASAASDGSVRLWRSGTFDMVALLPVAESEEWSGRRLAFHPTLPIVLTVGQDLRSIAVWELDTSLLDQSATAPPIQYLNAKVVLVGDRGVGKSGLGIRISTKRFRLTESTHGARFWQVQVPKTAMKALGLLHTQAELTVWDLAGQVDYHLVHQLFLDDTDLALLLFDCSDPADPFRGVPYWGKVLRKHSRSGIVKLLVSARVDVSPVTVDLDEVHAVMAEYGFNDYFVTSAKTGAGIQELRRRMVDSINWDTLTRTSRPRLFENIRQYLLDRKQAGTTLLRIAEVEARFAEDRVGHRATTDEVESVVALLQGRGLVHRLEPMPALSFVLLKPELINQYASSILQAARNHSHGIGAIAERDVIAAELPLDGVDRADAGDEKLILESTIELLISHDLCFREMGMLVFPSQLNTARRDAKTFHAPVEISYRFSGGVEATYASLVVRLSHTDYFHREEQWKYAAEFSRGGHLLGFELQQVEEGTGELSIHFHEGVTDFDRVIFVSFVTDHLHMKGIDIEERIRLYCPNCGREVTNQDAIDERVRLGELDIPCQYCGASVLMPRSVEERYRSSQAYAETQKQLSRKVAVRTEEEVEAFRRDHRSYAAPESDTIRMLHLSDLHLGTPEQALVYRTQLEADLRHELGVRQLEYLVITGDIADRSLPEEYEAAFDLVDGLVKGFGLNPDRIVIVPGNHDLNWDLSKSAYDFIYAGDVDDLSLIERDEQCIAAGSAGFLRRDEQRYKQRFKHFDEAFYRRVYQGRSYPLAYEEQAILHVNEQDRLLFLALNSNWNIDHHYRKRAGINSGALARALQPIMRVGYSGWRKIALWHHPVSSSEAMDDAFMQQLTVHGFDICLHGHIHEAGSGFYRYDASRGMHIIGAGTFGAPAQEQVPGIPLQYNLLTLDRRSEEMTVETRKKEKALGAWSADARWGNKNNPEPRYRFRLTRQSPLSVSTAQKLN